MKKWLSLILAASLAITPMSSVMAEEEIKPYIAGFGDGTFRPNEQITRAQAVSLFAEILESDERTAVAYSDIDTGAWYYDSLCKLNANGFLSNFTGSFYPEEAMTRIDFCQFIYALLNGNVVSPTEMFAKLTVDGIIKGYEDGSYGADRTITRAEAVALINRAMGVAAGPATISTLYRHAFSDVDSSHWAFNDIITAAKDSRNFKSFPLEIPADLETKEFDKYNEKGAEWQQVSMINDDLRSKGVTLGGEGAQRMNSIAISPDGQFLVEGNDRCIAHRSLDGGQTWEKSGRGLPGKCVGGYAIDPYNNSRVLAFTDYGIYLSTDKAYSWDLVLDQRNGANQLELKEPITYDASSYDEELGYCKVAYWSKNYWRMPNGLYTEDNLYSWDENRNDLRPQEIIDQERKGLWKSTDGGTTWEVINEEATDGAVKVHPTNGTVYLANHNGFFRSEDGGVTFEQILSGAPIVSLDTIATYPDRVYVSDHKGVLISEDCGKTFNRIETNSFPKAVDPTNAWKQPANLKVSPVNPNNMVIGYYAGFGVYQCSKYFSKDGGVTWTQSKEDASRDFLPSNNREPMFVWSPTDENKVWSFGGDWIVSSSDAGATYAWDYNGGSAFFIDQRSIFNIYDPNLFHFGSQDFHGAMTTDYGKNWKWIWKFSGWYAGFIYGSYALDPMTIIGFVNPGGGSSEMKLMISRDAGETWADTGVMRDDNSNKKWAELCYQSPKDPNIIFASQWRSTDYGYTWERMEGCDVVAAHNPYGEKQLYGVKDQYVVVSYDDGATWETFCEVKIPDECLEDPSTTEIWDIAYDGINDILYYISGPFYSGQYFCKVQNGVTTDLSDRRIKTDLQDTFQLCAVDPRYPNVIYLGGYRNTYVGDAGVMRSVDGGETFQLLSNLNLDLTIVKTGISGGIEPYDLIVHPTTGELWVPQDCAGWTKIAPPYEN